jgi:DNA-binding NarL/FixJ family response regulator
MYINRINSGLLYFYGLKYFMFFYLVQWHKGYANQNKECYLKILVVDDHILVREGLCYVLEKLGNNTNIVEADNYQQAVNLLHNDDDIDLILIDLNMPGEDGFTLLEFCRANYPSLPAIVLSASKQRADMQQALKNGALGFIPKDSTSQVMLGALRTIMTGELYIPPLMNDYNTQAQLNIDNTFTPRQKQVMIMVVQGLSNKSIALELGIAEATIKMHVSSIFKALGVQNRTEAALAAHKLGVVY